MGMFEHFPYTNFHDLNLDWILRHIKSLRDRLEDLIKEYNKTKVPGGGLANQVLTKKSDSDYDMIWKDSSGIPAGGSTGDILTKNSAADYDASWHADNNLKKSGGTLDNAATLEFVDDINSATISANGILVTGDKFQFSGDFGFTNPVSGQPPVDDTDLATKQYVDASTSSVDGVPAGGTAGQVLAKKTNADGDTEWVDQSGGGGDFLPLAGGTMNRNSIIEWPGINESNPYRIGSDPTDGYGIVHFPDANAKFRTITLGDVMKITATGFEPTGIGHVTSFNVSSLFPKWTFKNDVRATKAPTADESVVNKKYADSLAIPVGGTTGQVLGKKSNSDRDCEWINAPTPDVPNLKKAFAYQLPFVDVNGTATLDGFAQNLSDFFNTTYGIITLSFTSPDLGGVLVTDNKKYCVGIPTSVYIAQGASRSIPLFGFSNGSIKQCATLTLGAGVSEATITLVNDIGVNSALSAYISVTDYKQQEWHNQNG